MRLREPLAAKVPEITIMFWAIKLITTYMGEATSDFLGDKLGPGGGVIEVVLMVAAVWWQFRTRRYFAPAYWSLAMVIAISGTGASDTLHNIFHIPFYGTTLLWVVILAGVLSIWHRREGTLSIHSITTVRREAFYWATVMATFALGTALGDLTAITLKFGYFSSGVLFLVVIAIPAVAHRWLGLNSVLAFWFAYTITRPLGASLADWLGVPARAGGLDWGRGVVALILTVPILIAVGYMAVTHVDVAPGGAAAGTQRSGARHRAA
jgi:uncharacterized membrane-anchored protein